MVVVCEEGAASVVEDNKVRAGARQQGQGHAGHNDHDGQRGFCRGQGHFGLSFSLGGHTHKGTTDVLKRRCSNSRVQQVRPVRATIHACTSQPRHLDLALSGALSCTTTLDPTATKAILLALTGGGGN